MRLPLASLLLLLLAGCYTYQPVNNAKLPNGRQVRLTLTDVGTADLAAQLGPTTESVLGSLVGDSAGAYLLVVTETRKRNGIEIGWQGERVAIPRAMVANVHQRQFSRTRTAAVSAALIAALVVTREIFWGPGGTFGGATPKPGPAPR